MMRREPAAIAVTMGEPAGISGEITIKAWLARGDLPAFFVIGDPAWLSAVAHRFGLSLRLALIDHPEEAANAFPLALPVLSELLAAPECLGEPRNENAPAVIRAIDRAVENAMTGRASAVVTNPIHKKTLYDAGFHAPGHTEYLAELSGPDVRPVMMLCAPGLRTVPVTIHRPLAEAVATLRAEEIVRCGLTLHHSLQRDFSIDRPRIAVAGLNPHAGEGGSLGTEERSIIGPAIDTLRRRGVLIEGPMAADAMFHPGARRGYDAALCMYHDQALIPVKTLAFSSAVNTTLGLPFVRTSPDHGAALDIATRGQADPSSLIAAIRLASAMAASRRDAGDQAA